MQSLSSLNSTSPVHLSLIWDKRTLSPDCWPSGLRPHCHCTREIGSLPTELLPPMCAPLLSAWVTALKYTPILPAILSSVLDQCMPTPLQAPMWKYLHFSFKPLAINILVLISIHQPLHSSLPTFRPQYFTLSLYNFYDIASSDPWGQTPHVSCCKCLFLPMHPIHPPQTLQLPLTDINKQVESQLCRVPIDPCDSCHTWWSCRLPWQHTYTLIFLACIVQYYKFCFEFYNFVAF